MLGIAMTRIKLLETCGEFHRAVKSCVERSVRSLKYILIVFTFLLRYILSHKQWRLVESYVEL